MKEACFTQNLQDFSFPRSDRSGQFEDLRMIKFTDSKFAPKIMVWDTMAASGVSELIVLPPNQIERAKYNQENILSLFLPDDTNKTSETGKVTERRFMKTCWI